MVTPAPVDPCQVRMFQLTDAAGRAAALELLQPIPSQWPRSIIETTMDFLALLTPSSTGVLGEYGYVDPLRGSGRLRLEGYGDMDLDTIDGLIRTAEISRSIGRADPRRPDELGSLRSVVPRTTNPFIQIATGCVALTFGVICVVLGLVGSFSGGPAAIVAIVIVGLGLIGVGVWAMSIGLRRRAWWLAARAEAARRGQSLPEQLKFWN